MVNTRLKQQIVVYFFQMTNKLSDLKLWDCLGWDFTCLGFLGVFFLGGGERGEGGYHYATC